MKHHYHFDIFNITKHFQLQEFDSTFGEREIKLLTFNSAFDPYDAYKFFKIDDKCNLAKRNNFLDFSEQEKFNLKFQMKYFKLDAHNYPKSQNLSSFKELCQGLIEIEK